ncbi:tetratricopeptide repeat protein [Spirosoma soli]|uniref:Tetratricopeptide repeat protein n=1 Tax=Spirosoma soli TaxID=1770529 RepID=A0ABW5M4U9_9BACT
MKRLVFLSLLCPLSALAQTGEQYLKAYESTLALNRKAPTMHFFAVKREQIRQDTMAASGPAYRFRGLDYVRRQEYEQAAYWFEKTANTFPKEHGAIGEFYMSFLHDYSRALQHLDAYDALTPNFDDLINNNRVSYIRGLTYRCLGDHDKAIEQFSISIDPLEAKHGAEWVNYRHFVSRAVSYIAPRQPEKALVDLDKAIKNFNRSALVQYYRGQALLQLNRTAEARTAFQDASFFYKALRYERTGNYQEDDFNPIVESEIEDALTKLKN